MNRELLQTSWHSFARSSGVEPDAGRQDPVKWAAAREAFYDEFGPMPVPSSDADRLSEIRDRYRGERIFVIGNGPSLLKTPLEFLQNEFTFGVNRFYLTEDALGFKPTFQTVVDWRVAADCADELSALDDRTFFLPERFRGLLDAPGSQTYWYHHNGHPDKEKAHFSPDASEGIRGAGSVIGSAIQLAFHMGFDPIYLIGCDLTYSVSDTVVQSGPQKFDTGVRLHLQSTADDDPNHFDPRYFGAGRRWHDPNVPRMFQGYAACQDGIASRGRSLFNATVGGRLESSPRVNIHALLLADQDADQPEPLPSAAERIMDQLLASESEPSGTAVVFGGKDPLLAALLCDMVGSTYIFEPSQAARDDLKSYLGPRAGLRIDARFLGPAEHAGVPAYRDESTSGLSSIMLSDASRSVGPVPMTTLQEAMTNRRVDQPRVAWIACGANTADALVQCRDLEDLRVLGLELGTGTGPEFALQAADFEAVAAAQGLSCLAICADEDAFQFVALGNKKPSRPHVFWVAVPPDDAARLVDTTVQQLGHLADETMVGTGRSVTLLAMESEEIAASLERIATR